MEQNWNYKILATSTQTIVKTRLKLYGRIAEQAFASPRSWSSGCGPITIPEHNHVATLCLQELASTLLIQKLIQVHLRGNTSPDYQVIPLPISIYKFPLTISYQLLCVAGHHVLHRVLIDIDTTHPQAVPLLVDNSLGRLEELLSILMASLGFIPIISVSVSLSSSTNP